MASKTLTLSDRGEIKTAIILPEGAGEILREAARDLQAVLEKMTGMALPIGSDDGKPAPSGRTAIHVGRTACARSLNLDAKDVGVEGYRITTSGGDLFILGGSDSGASYGVYGLLEDHLVRLRIDYVRRWFPFPATLVRGWRWADEVLATSPGAGAQEKAQALRRLPARLTRAFRQAVLEDRLMPKHAYFGDGRYQARVEAPWKEKVEKAVVHAQG